ncbi:MAG TPA: MATE family efflux transporter [Haliangium sp.]|nr:MATE family efflux transporter [Haliangium sp.]
MSREPATLPWIAHPLREMLRLAWPVAVSTISYSAMTLVDTLFVSWLGAASVAGVGLAGVTGFTLLCFPLGLMQGVKVLVSQAVGAHRHEGIGAHLRAGLLVAVAMGLGIVVLAQVAAPLLDLLAPSREAGRLAGTWLRIRLLSAPVFLSFAALRETAYGAGDTRSPMIASLLANLANIALCALFVLGMDMGVAGAAWATVCANCVEAAVLLGARFDLVRQALGPAARGRRAQVAAVWSMGLPTGGQFLLEVGAFTLLTFLISAMSEIEMAAHQIVLQVLHVAFLPAQAVAEAGAVLAGQAVGASRDDLIGGVARRALALAGGYAVLSTLGSFFGADLVLRAFTEDPDLIREGVGLMHAATLFLLTDAANMVARGVLRGTGDVGFAAIVGIVSAWCLTPPLTWLLGYHFALGVRGAWLGLCAEIAVGAAILGWRLWRGGWRSAAERSRATLHLGAHAPAARAVAEPSAATPAP